jgi:hypothetical protein
MKTASLAKKERMNPERKQHSVSYGTKNVTISISMDFVILYGSTEG